MSSASNCLFNHVVFPLLLRVLCRLQLNSSLFSCVCLYAHCSAKVSAACSVHDAFCFSGDAGFLRERHWQHSDERQHGGAALRSPELRARFSQRHLVAPGPEVQHIPIQ